MNFNLIKTIIASCCLVFVTSMSTPVFSANLSDSSINQADGRIILHTVDKGETVYSIAKMYNLPVSEIYNYNPKAESGIRVGENLIIPQKGAVLTNYTSPNTFSDYTVRPKETLYSISKQFDVKVDEIIDLNPSLKSNPLYEGQIIKIPNKTGSTAVQPSTNSISQNPQQFIQHRVASKETMYGIAKQYNVTPNALIDFNPDLKNGLKENTLIIIPVLQTTSAGTRNTIGSTLLDVNAINIGLILPFLNKSEGQSARFLEYYEGFLLALQEMKAKGFSANVYVFDMGSESGTAKLVSLLDTYEMKDLDLIIGGVSPEQVNIIANFAKKEGIKYAIPFPTKTDVTLINDRVFQVNENHSMLMSSIPSAFASRFAGSNVIIVTDGSNDKKDFIKNLTTQLSNSGVIAHSVPINSNLTANLASAIDLNRRNIIVAGSGTTAMLQSLLPVLNTITTENPRASITLFGHTEWQTYAQYMNEYNKYDTYIYTPFFMDENDLNTRQFIANYKKWYNNKSLINTYPKYGALGYDTGLYFINALKKYGKNFENSSGSNTVSTLQTPFSFRRLSPTGGYMNTGFYFVHYNTNGNIEKIAYTQ